MLTSLLQSRAQNTYLSALCGCMSCGTCDVVCQPSHLSLLYCSVSRIPVIWHPPPRQTYRVSSGPSPHQCPCAPLRFNSDSLSRAVAFHLSCAPLPRPDLCCSHPDAAIPIASRPAAVVVVVKCTAQTPRRSYCGTFASPATSSQVDIRPGGEIGCEQSEPFRLAILCSSLPLFLSGRATFFSRSSIGDVQLIAGRYAAHLLHPPVEVASTYADVNPPCRTHREIVVFQQLHRTKKRFT